MSYNNNLYLIINVFSLLLVPLVDIVNSWKKLYIAEAVDNAALTVGIVL